MKKQISYPSVGTVLQSWTVTGETQPGSPPRTPVRCACGTCRTVSVYDLLSGKSRNCGCVRRRSVGLIARTHGKARTAEHVIWLAMIDRCRNPRNKNYPRYGGRGITVCDRWMESFAAFLSDMGKRPSRKHSIDRIDNDHGYEPGNCRWATVAEQHRNKSNTVRLTAGGVTRTMTEWAAVTGIPYSTLRNRRRCGWPDESIVGVAPLSIAEVTARARAERKRRLTTRRHSTSPIA